MTRSHWYKVKAVCMDCDTANIHRTRYSDRIDNNIILPCTKCGNAKTCKVTEVTLKNAQYILAYGNGLTNIIPATNMQEAIYETKNDIRTHLLENIYTKYRIFNADDPDIDTDKDGLWCIDTSNRTEVKA